MFGNSRVVSNNIPPIATSVGFLDSLKDSGGWEVSLEWMDVDNSPFSVAGWKSLDANLLLETDLKVTISDEFTVWDEYQGKVNLE